MDVYVARCSHGLGLFAARPFECGEAIVDFEGPEQPDPKDGTSAEANLLQVGLGRYVMPADPAVRANHSCAPNSGFRGTPTLRAMVPIDVGQEICFDYATCMLQDDWTHPCRCGAASCRGVIAEFSTLPRVLRERYIQQGWVLQFIADYYTQCGF